MNILQLIASSNFITVNKEIIKKIGLEEAILLGELASEFDYWSKRNELDDGYFYSTIENIEENTTLTRFKQDKAIKKLKQLGILEVKVKGIPARRYIKINEGNLYAVLSANKNENNSQTSLQMTYKLECEPVTCNNNIINNNIINNNIQERKKEDKVQTEEIKNDVPAKKSKTKTQNYNEIIDAYTENAELKEVLLDFIKMRKLNKKIMSNRALNMLLKKLNTYASNDKEKIQILENSILKSWQDIYPLNNEEEKPFKQVKKLNNSIPKDEETYKRMKQFEELGIGYDNEF